jgi:cell wall assembly regulator SMI1
MNLEWQFGEPITQATLSQIESQLGVSFPQDFAEVILDHSGAYPSLSTFDYPGHSGAVFNNLISFDLTSDYSILATLGRIQDRLPPLVFPIANDPGGNCLCFDFRTSQDQPEIVFWDHKYLPDHPRNLRRVAGSFSELLGMLYEE